MFSEFFTPIVDLIASPLKGWVQRKKVQTETKLEIEKLNAEAAIERAKNAQAAENDWDNIAQQQRQYSWVDEAWTAATLLMLGGCFFPHLQPYMAKGFEVLHSAPWWLELSIVGQIAAAFGLRWLFKDFLGRFK